MPPHQHDHTPSDAHHASAFFAFGRQPDGRYRLPPNLVPDNVELIGDGDVGGKARGLIFVMHYIERGGRLADVDHLLRFPRSTVLATDVFDAFMKRNRLDEDVQAGCDRRITLAELGERIASAEFPPEWKEQLLPLLGREHRPLVVRSSSVMEDDPDHSFAGIYLSEFLTNRGPLEKRLSALVASIQRVYASTFASNARAYRKRHHLDWRREKMAVLIQNMIGSQYSHGLFYPLVGGVAFSRNYYPWTERLSVEDGVVRLVVGVGTRAVGREYARVFSPRMPGLRPEGNDPTAIVQFSQETVDVLDMHQDRLETRKLHELDNPLLTKICSIVGSDGSLREPMSSAAMLTSGERLVASFSRLIEGNTLMPLTPLVRHLLHSLEELMSLPVDVEFALDFSSPEASDQQAPLFYLLQVRPLGNRPEHRRITAPDVPDHRVVLQSHRVLGNGMRAGIRHLILVEPSTYRWDRAYDIARSIGRINHELVEQDEPYILIGPGRWASSNPQLGVPVQYGEISGAAVIVEMSTASFAAELSYGTHFYADMVASDVLYLPVSEPHGDLVNRSLLDAQELVHRDPFVTHYRIPRGLDVYVDALRQRGIVALRAPS